MVINNFHFVKLSISPYEADAILLVDPNAVLSFSAATQKLKVISRRHAQIVQIRRVVQVLQLSQGNALDGRRDAAAFPRLIQFPGVCVPEAGDHPGDNITSLVIQIKGINDEIRYFPRRSERCHWPDAGPGANASAFSAILLL
jgi:hypothetical protein